MITLNLRQLPWDDARRRPVRRRRVDGEGTRQVGSCQFLAKFRSFSAVSVPIFARKYAFCSIFQNLPDSQAEIFEI